jgi:hypothetical protein
MDYEVSNDILDTFLDEFDRSQVLRGKASTHSARKTRLSAKKKKKKRKIEEARLLSDTIE